MQKQNTNFSEAKPNPILSTLWNWWKKQSQSITPNRDTLVRHPSPILLRSHLSLYLEQYALVIFIRSYPNKTKPPL